METAQFRARYEMDCKWRSAWDSLSQKFERGRLQTKQDQIDRKANIANARITKLMRDFDDLMDQ